MSDIRRMLRRFAFLTWIGITIGRVGADLLLGEPLFGKEMVSEVIFGGVALFIFWRVVSVTLRDLESSKKKVW